MKKVLLILACLSLTVAGCGPVASNAAPSDPANAAAQDAPAVMLEAPNRARDAAAEANERARQVQEALPQPAGGP